ncbi:MAG: sugar phosphate nucleotidyltransferase [Candidatus Diapherotrites archaeon]|nr:sugar phosphate nucleotidyltransferase [Candidatus Diapherotrites archaeon]
MRERITITIKQEILDQVDRMVDGLNVRSRSQAFEFLLSKVLTDVKLKTCLILAGGEKNKIMIDRKPKFLQEIKGKELLIHSMDAIHKHHVGRFLVYVDNFGEEIAQKLSQKQLQYNLEFIQGKTSSGTIEPLQLAKDKLNDTFLLAYGDTISNVNIQEMLQFHREQKAIATIALTTVSNPKDYGVAILQGNKVKAFIQKPSKDLGSYIISTGYFLFEPEVFKYLSRNDTSLEKDLLPRLAEKGLLNGYTFQGLYLNINSKKDLERAEILL